MSDLLSRIDVYLQFAGASTAVMELPAGCDHPLTLLTDAKSEIEHLRSVVGAVSAGPSFAEITKDLPRRGGESD